MDSTYAYIYGLYRSRIHSHRRGEPDEWHRGLRRRRCFSDRCAAWCQVREAYRPHFYDAWGSPETTGGLTSYTSFGFAGGYTDPTGLVYLINR